MHDIVDDLLSGKGDRRILIDARLGAEFATGHGFVKEDFYYGLTEN